MHELAVTESILRICRDEGEKRKLKCIKKINIKVGELTGLVPNAVEYYFEIISKDTLAEGAKINIEKLPIKIECRGCNYKGLLERDKSTCPICKGYNFKIVNGNDFYIDTLEVE